MPIPTPFYTRTAPECVSHRWKDWAGYHAACYYGDGHLPEYYALRHAAGVIDVSPLFKYDIFGADASALLSKVLVRDVRQMKVGQVYYCCWCDDDGFILDDGTVSRLGSEHFRLTAAVPTLTWLLRHSRKLNVTIEDTSTRLGALSIQGPTARSFLQDAVSIDLADLKYFRVSECQIAGVSGWVSRTGYTGDLGYELWVNAADADAVYDELMSHRSKHGVMLVGLDAMDMARIEAGMIMNGVDYFSANQCLIDARKSTPFELGLGWMVQLDREPFTGQQALSRLAKDKPDAILCGLEIDWVEFEELFADYDLPPEVPAGAWRTPVPIYDDHVGLIGHANSGSWSPTLKKNLALASIQPSFAKVGSKVKIEVTAMYERDVVTATVVQTPFFNPERKRT